MHFAGSHVNSYWGKNSPKRRGFALSFHRHIVSMRNGLTSCCSACASLCSEQKLVLGRQMPAQQQGLRAQKGSDISKSPWVHVLFPTGHLNRQCRTNVPFINNWLVEKPNPTKPGWIHFVCVHALQSDDLAGPGEEGRTASGLSS